MDADQVRDARPGEMCRCGQPARAVLVRQLGEVPTCRTPEEYRAEIEQTYRTTYLGILGSSGQSGAR